MRLALRIIIVILLSKSMVRAADPVDAPACMAIQGDSIVAGDLARTMGVFRSIDAQRVVSPSPMAGARRWFRVPELARIARLNNVAATDLHDVCFEWPLKTLDAPTVAKAMARELKLDAGAIEIAELSQFPAPPGELIFARASLLPISGGEGRMLYWRGYVQYAGNRKFPVWARLRVTAPARRVVARTTLMPGVVVDEKQLELVTLNDSYGAGNYAMAVNEVAGRMPRVRIEPNVPLRLIDLSDAPDIAAGDDVRIEVRNGPLRLSLMGKAERSGRVGEVISFVNPLSSARFRARVEGRDVASIVVPGSTK